MHVLISGGVVFGMTMHIFFFCGGGRYRVIDGVNFQGVVSLSTF